MFTDPLVSVVVLNWNGLPDVEKCVSHIKSQSYQSIELIIVDNGSTDGSLAFLKQKFSRATFIRHETNLGFSRGMNVGIAASRGEFVIPLNQDAFLDREFVSAAVAAVQPDATAGSVSGLVLPAYIQDSRKTSQRPEAGIVIQKYFRGVMATPAQSGRLLGPGGCCPFLRRIALEDVALSPGQYFDESYGTGGEDLDLFLRLQIRGWHCVYAPEVIAHHVGSGSVGGATRLVEKPLWYQRNALRNRYYSIIKNLPASILLRLSPYILATEIGIWPYFLFTSPKTLGALVWAWRELAGAMPQLLQKRKRIQSRRLATKKTLLALFV